MAANSNQLLAVRRGWLVGQFFRSWFLRGVIVGFLWLVWRRMAAGGGVTSLDYQVSLGCCFQRCIEREPLTPHVRCVR